MIAAVFFDLGGTLVDYGGSRAMPELISAGIKNVYGFLKHKKYSLPPLHRFEKK